MTPPRLLTLDNEPLSWPEAHRRARAWWARERRGELHIVEPPPPSPTIQRLVAKCAELLEIKATDVLSQNRGHLPSLARAACYQVLREAGWTLKEIGAAFNRDFSTVADQLRRCQLRARVDSEVAYLLSELRRFPIDPTPRRLGQASS